MGAFKMDQIDTLRTNVYKVMLEEDPASEKYAKLTDKMRILCECDKLYQEARLAEWRKTQMVDASQAKQKAMDAQFNYSNASK